jgi:hypothetical protein
MDRYVRYDFFIPAMISPRVIANSKAASLEAHDVRNPRHRTGAAILLF